jgi:hypothetical protein
MSNCSVNCFWNWSVAYSRLIGNTVNGDYYLRHVCVSVRLSTWTISPSTWQISMRFDVWVILENRSIEYKVIKIWQEKSLFHTKTYAYLWSYLPKFILEWEMFPTKVVEKIITHILCSIIFFPEKSYRLWDNVGKYGTAGQATDDNIIWRMRIACWVIKVTDIHIMKYLLLSHGNNGYANAPQYYVCRYICLSSYYITERW